MVVPDTVSSRGPSSGMERRRAERIQCDGSPACQIRVGVGANPELARVRDISTTGISLVLKHRVELETEVNVDLTHQERNFNCQVPMKVVYVIEHPGGEFVMGGPFTRDLSNIELQELL